MKEEGIMRKHEGFTCEYECTTFCNNLVEDMRSAELEEKNADHERKWGFTSEEILQFAEMEPP